MSDKTLLNTDALKNQQWLTAAEPKWPWHAEAEVERARVESHARMVVAKHESDAAVHKAYWGRTAWAWIAEAVDNVTVYAVIAFFGWLAYAYLTQR